MTPTTVQSRRAKRTAPPSRMPLKRPTSALPMTISEVPGVNMRPSSAARRCSSSAVGPTPRTFRLVPSSSLVPFSRTREDDDHQLRRRQRLAVLADAPPPAPTTSRRRCSGRRPDCTSFCEPLRMILALSGAAGRLERLAHAGRQHQHGREHEHHQRQAERGHRRGPAAHAERAHVVDDRHPVAPRPASSAPSTPTTRTPTDEPERRRRAASAAEERRRR